MDAQTANTRFQLWISGTTHDHIVSTHASFADAEAAQAAMGPKAAHIKFHIVDNTRNILVDAADDTEMKLLEKQEALQKRRRELMDAQEEDIKRAEELKARSQAVGLT